MRQVLSEAYGYQLQALQECGKRESAAQLAAGSTVAAIRNARGRARALRGAAMRRAKRHNDTSDIDAIF